MNASHSNSVCLTSKEIEDYRCHTLSREDWKRVTSHLGKCPSCKEAVRHQRGIVALTQVLKESLEETPDEDSQWEPHLSGAELQMLAEVKGRLPLDRQRHFNSCAACQEEVREFEHHYDTIRAAIPPPHSWKQWCKDKAYGRPLILTVRYGFLFACLLLAASQFYPAAPLDAPLDAKKANFLGNVLPLIIPWYQAAYIGFLWFLLPPLRVGETAEVKRASQVARQFRTAIRAMLACLCLGYLVFGAEELWTRFLGIKKFSDAYLWIDVVQDLLGRGVVAAWGLGYFVLTYPSIGKIPVPFAKPKKNVLESSPEAAKEWERFPVAAGIAIGACCILTLHTISYVFGWGMLVLGTNHEDMVRYIGIMDGCLGGVFLTLLVTRLDVTTLDLPTSLLSALIAPLLCLYGVIQALQSLFVSSPRLELFLFTVAFLAKGVLVCLIAFAMQTGRLVRMIVKINEERAANQPDEYDLTHLGKWMEEHKVGRME